jgi:hypothetical protein
MKDMRQQRATALHPCRLAVQYRVNSEVKRMQCQPSANCWTKRSTEFEEELSIFVPKFLVGIGEL